MLPADFCFRYDCGFFILNLAITWNSLAHFSKRKIRYCSTLRLRRFHTLSVCNHLISCSLHLPQGVLCNFHSRYYYAIGLELYLGLEVYVSHIHARYPTHATLEHQKSPTGLPLQGYHPLWRLVPEDFELAGSEVNESKLHISQYSSYRDSVCPIGLSIAFNNPISIDFFSSAYSDVSIRQVPPHISEYHKSGGIPLGDLRIKSSLRLHGVISRLGTTFFSTRAEQSTKWRNNWLKFRPDCVCKPLHYRNGNDH